MFFGVRTREESRIARARRGNDRDSVRRHCAGRGSIGNRCSLKDRVVDQAVEIDSNLQLMASMPLLGSEGEVGERLPATRDCVRGEVVVSLDALRSHDVGYGPCGDEIRTVFVKVEAIFQQLAARKKNLILDSGEVACLFVGRRAGRRTKNGHTVVKVALAIKQITGGKDIRSRVSKSCRKPLTQVLVITP